MRVIALDAEHSLKDMIKVFHYAYIDENTVVNISNIVSTSIKEDLGYYLHIDEQFLNRLLLQVIREAMTNYIDNLLKAVIHNSVHAVFDGLQNRFRLSDVIHTRIHDQGTLIPIFNSVYPDLSILIDIELIMYKSIATVLDRIKVQNQNNLVAKTMQFITTVQPQLVSERVDHVVRTDLLNGRTVAIMVV